MAKLTIYVRFPPDGVPFVVTGRVAWALTELVIRHLPSLANALAKAMESAIALDYIAEYHPNANDS